MSSVLSFRAPSANRPRQTLTRAAAFAFLAGLVLLSSSVLSHRAAEAAPAPGTPLRDRVAFGAYIPDLPAGRTGLPALETQLGAKMQLASAFTDWSYIFGNANDRWMADNGTRKVLYSWEPFGLRFSAVANGSQDAYLQRVADSMKAYPYDIYVRPWGEMNANWSSWQPTADGGKRDGGKPEEFIAAWRHTVSFFRNQGVNNLKFVFNPDAADFTDNTRIPTIWPGAEYVDVLGIDGYNWGANAATGDTWRDFDAIFTNMYGILTSLHPTAPVWIAEFGTKEPTYDDGAPANAAHSKGQWFTNMMSSTGFPRIEALAYFNVKKERDWRFDSSADSLNALRTQLALRGATPPPASTTTTSTTKPSTTTTSTTKPSTTTTTTKPSTTTSTTKPSTTTTTKPTTTTTVPPATTTPSTPPTTGTATGTRPVALRNASLEADANGDGTPDCFVRAGYGTNTARWTRTTAAHSGTSAQQLDLSAVVDGDRKLVIALDDASCAPAVTPGTTYNVSAWYRSSVPARLVTYYRDAAGTWQYWSTSTVPATSTWAQARVTTAAVPAGATALSYGLALDTAGTLTVDDFAVEANVRNLVANASLEIDANGDSVPDGFARAGYGTNTATWARVSDARTGSWAQRVTVTGWATGDRKLVPDMVQPGVAPAAVAGTRYTIGAAYKSTAPVALVTYYRDAAGVWQYWETAPTLTAQSAWTSASYVTPPLPAGATAVSFGLALSANGTLTVDDFSMTA